ncbi:hypothetical protein MJG53_006436 [Ovis ammon polii x Ovis aries]|uniref:Uncharacterized protein n=1 Tax=Ovis ammon polii x Ovis aries TaxID=2918886 RepID=A0ACB9V5E1_9CETA|nr:hypothetical protein MJG53_006436 [Ovis ammon polii x Ovis aries]
MIDSSSSHLLANIIGSSCAIVQNMVALPTMLGEKQIQRVFSFCESTEQRRLAQSEDLRKLPDGENGAYWTIEKEQSPGSLPSRRMGVPSSKLGVQGDRNVRKILLAASRGHNLKQGECYEAVQMQNEEMTLNQNSRLGEGDPRNLQEESLSERRCRKPSVSVQRQQSKGAKEGIQGLKVSTTSKGFPGIV